MIVYLWVALGGAIGSVARFAVGIAVARAVGERFPWGTIGINVVGSFVIGWFAGLTAPGGAMPASVGLRAFVMVGLCGGFTTFSAFSLQTLSLAKSGTWPAAAANVVLSVTLCLGAVTLGHIVAQRTGTFRG